MAGYPLKKNTAVTIVFPIRDADGDLVGGAADLDSEVSIDGAAFADCTNEAADITSAAANTGLYSLALVAAETNGNVICILVKTSTAGAKSTVLVFYTSTRQIDDLAYPATSGRSLQVESDGMVHADLKEVLGVAPNALQSGRIDAYIGAKAAGVALSTQEKADVNEQVDSALDTAIPASPTANSINERLKTIDDRDPSNRLTDEE